MKNGGLSFHRAVADETKLLKLMLKLVKGVCIKFTTQLTQPNSE